MTPAWILDVLAALMLVVAAVSAARIAAARPWRRGAVAVDTDAAHLLMAIAMAGMLAPGLGTLPAGAWEVVFWLLGAWFAGRVLVDAWRSGIRALAGGHCAPHLVHSGSMLYMFLAASAPAARASGMSGGTESANMALSHPTLAFAFAFALVGYGIWDLDQLSGHRYASGLSVSLAGVGAGGAVGAVGLPVLVGAQAPPVLPPGAAPGDTALDRDGAAQATEAAAEMALDAGRAVEMADGHAAASRDGGAVGAGGPRHGGGGGFLRSPAVTVGGRITMGITMAFMLLIAL